MRFPTKSAADACLTTRPLTANQFGMVGLALLAAGAGVVHVQAQNPPNRAVVVATVPEPAPAFPIPMPSLTAPAMLTLEASPNPAYGAAPVAAPIGECSAIPEWFPSGIAWRESTCRYDVASSGAAYLGAFQIASFHWQTGACSDLDWTVAAQQDECAWRLSEAGTDFSPWGA